LSAEDKKVGTLVSAVSDGVYIFALRDDNTIWMSHPHLPPLSWTQLPEVPSREVVTSLGVTFCDRDLSISDPTRTLFVVTKVGNLWFYDGVSWTQETTP
jgi:hypothetical protein